LSIVLPSIALALSYYLDLPAGPASVALLAVSVPFAAMSNVAAGRGDGERRPQAPPMQT
jgi:ABC-type Mn2+/Zn2+ transport system permease subunit